MQPLQPKQQRTAVAVKLLQSHQDSSIDTITYEEAADTLPSHTLIHDDTHAYKHTAHTQTQSRESMPGGDNVLLIIRWMIFAAL